MSYNPIMLWLLYSPLHGVLSKYVMAINYEGRKSGKSYRIPIGYKRNGETLVTISFKHRQWWRNLRGGIPVTLRLQGVDINGVADVIEDETGVMEGIMAFCEGSPRAAKMFRVKIDNQGQLEIESLRKAARERVVVQTVLK